MFIVFSYHIHLLCIGQTTNENLTRVYRSDRNPNNFSCIANFSRAFCGELSSSKVGDMEETVTVKQYVLEIFGADAEETVGQKRPVKLDTWATVPRASMIYGVRNRDGDEVIESCDSKNSDTSD